MNARTISTLGYAGWTPEAITALVDRLGATLVDIRLAPTSRTPCWRGEALKALVGRLRYYWLRDLGNANAFSGGPMELLSPACAVGPIRRLLERGPVILLCGCADVQRCHRLIAANYLAAALPDVTIEHLSPPEPEPATLAAGEIAALTLLQPWAAFVEAATIDRDMGKWVETRGSHFPKGFRGRLAIHAATLASGARNGVGREELAWYFGAEPFASALRLAGYATVDDLPFGKVVATATVTNILPTEQLLGGLVGPSTPNALMGDYGPGRVGLLLDDIQRVTPPIPARGMQGIWRWKLPPALRADGREGVV